MLTHLLVCLVVNVCDLAIFWIFELLFTNLQCYKLTMLQTYNVANLQCYKLTMLQTYNVTNLQCYKLTMLQTYNVTNLQCYKLKLSNFLTDIVNLLLDNSR